MGLDQYLSRKIYIGAQYEHNKITGKIDIKKDGKPLKIDLSKVSEIEQNVAYWRKANMIHRWMVENIQDGTDDCGEYELTKKKAQELLNVCNEVLSASKLVDGVVKNGERLIGGVWTPILEEGKEIEDSKTAERLLPSASGFFFGGTDYDEYYYQDVKYTAEILDEILRTDNPDKEFFEHSYYYSSSW